MRVEPATQGAGSMWARQASLPRRWGEYLSERFPLLANGLLILSFYSSNQCLAHALIDPGSPMRYGMTTAMGFLVLLAFFLHLRVFDDQKDYDDDCRNFPDRVLQRGMVTLPELKTLAAIAVGAELVLAALGGPAVLVSVLLAFGFTLLMRHEFFASTWLKRRFLLYASTHMMIMPLLAMVVFSFATGQYPWEAPGWYWLYALVGFFLAFNWEVSRKIRAPEDELEGVESYTRLFGTYGAMYLVLVIRGVATGLVAVLGLHLGLGIWFHVFLIGLFLLCLVGSLQYRFRTNSGTGRRMETYAGIYIFAFDLALAIELARIHGVTWEGWG